MNKTIFIISLFFSCMARSEFFSCEQLKGYVTDGLGGKKTIKQKICNSPADDKIIYKNGCSYYVDDEKFSVVCDNKIIEECFTIKNTLDEAVAVCPGTIAHGTYLISKDEHKVFYSKVGKIKFGYAQMFEAKCN